MKEFFDVCISLVYFVLDLIEDVAEMVAMIANAVINIPVYLAYVYPVQIVTAITAVLTVVVVYKVLGRD